MRKFRKLSLLLAALMTISIASTACDQLLLSPINSSNGSSQAESLLTSSKDEQGSFTESSSFEEISSEESLESSFEETSDSEESSSEEVYDEELLAMQQTVDLAYDLAYGETLGSYTLTGTITNIQEDGTKYNADLLVEGREDFPIYLYNLQGDTADIEDGDIITVFGKIKNYKGTVEFESAMIMGLIHQDKPSMGKDPYANMSESEFYANYTPATSYTDAYFRTKHGFMSGELTVPDQAPTLANYQPMSNGKFVRNSEMLFDESGKEYTVVDCYGNPAFTVYRDGAYITLEEVAAFVYAFGTYPANYTTSKNTSPLDSVWGEYLRVNHTAFSGSTSKYPYEPELPNISGCGGTLNYFEMDIGTTGTDCDPSYTAALYNNGYSITRGAARIVYGKKDLDKDGVYEIGEHHVFYTYNHYNDFQEYLNYEGGWGEMFGNITGGGTISSKTDYNPTDYVDVVLQPLTLAYGSRSLANFYRNYYGV
jgi:hypothetical protein